MTLSNLPLPNFTGADLSARVNAAVTELRAGRRFASLATLLADATLAYGSGARAVAAGDAIEAEGLRYQVAASTAGDHHLTTAGGVKLHIRPVGGAFEARAFGLKADGATDDTSALAAACGAAVAPGSQSRRVILPAGTIRLNGSVALGGASLLGQGSAATTIHFHGAGWCLEGSAASGQEVAGIRLVSQAAGQSGVRILSGIGPRLRDLLLQEFDGTSFQLGNTTAGQGVYFADVDGVTVNNQTRTGAVGLLIDGGGIAASNGNGVRNWFVKGRITKHVHVKGSKNIFIGGDMEPNNSLATVSECLHVEGIGNEFNGPYLEPVGATKPSVFIRFAAVANNNKVRGVYTPSGGNSPFAAIVDAGVGNEVEIQPTGFNFAPSVGVSRSPHNLLPNAGFHNLKSDGAPLGWLATITGASTVVRATDQLRGAPYAMKFTCTGDGKAELTNWFATTSPTAGTRMSFNDLPLAKLRGKTGTLGVWCWSATAGFGAIKAFEGSQSIGVARHSGSGAWEFLSVQVRFQEAGTHFAFNLRSNTDNANSTGTCWFTEPVLVFGTDIPQVPEPRFLPDGDARLAGRLAFSPKALFAAGATTPDVSGGNFFGTANTGATVITNFTGGVDGQELRIRAGDANTTVANNANIVTATGANRALANGALYRFIRDGSVWVEG